MFLSNLGRELLRRWYFVLFGLLLTSGGGLFAWTTVPPTYQVTCTAVLLPPTSLVGENGNPYLFMGGLEQVLTVLTVRLSSTEVAEPLITGRGNVSYSVEKDPRSPGPIMLITATGESKESAAQVLDDVIRVVPENLVIMQDQLRIPTYSRVGIMTVVRDTTPVRLTKDQMRLILGVVGFGLTVTVLATALLDRILTSTTAKRRADRFSDGTDPWLALTQAAETPHPQRDPAHRGSPAGEKVRPARARDAVPAREERDVCVSAQNE